MARTILNPGVRFILMAVVALMISADAGFLNAERSGRVGWLPGGRAGCDTSIGECLGGEEMAMESESNRRILQTTQYIGYEVMDPNKVLCSLQGAPYSNCRPGAPANPYSRGCSLEQRCARS